MAGPDADLATTGRFEERVLTSDICSKREPGIGRPADAAIYALVARISARLLATPADRLDDVVTDALAGYCSFVGADGASLYRAENDGQWLVRTHTWSRSATAPFVGRQPERYGTGELAWMADALDRAAPSTLFIPETADLSDDAHRERETFARLGIRSLATSQVHDHGVALGVVNAVWTTGPAPDGTATTLRAFGVLGTILLAALDRSRAERTLRCRRDAEALVTRLSQSMTAVTSAGADDAVANGLAAATEFVGAQIGRLIRRTTPPDWATLNVSISPAGERAWARRVEQPPVTEWLRERLGTDDVIVLHDLDEYPQELLSARALLARVGAQSVAFLPVRTEGEFTGWVSFVWTRAPVTRDVEAALPALRVLGDMWLLTLERSESDARTRGAIDERRRVEALLRAFVRESCDLLWVADASGVLRYASPETRRSHSVDAVGMRVADVVHAIGHPDDADGVLATFDEIRNLPRQALPLSFRLRSPDGEWRRREGTVVNLLDEPDVAGIVWSGRDVTRRDELEEQLRQSQKMEAIGQLAGGVAHDFNNLLTAISGYTALLLDQHPEGETNHDLRQIEAAARRAGALVDQLLQFSRRREVRPGLVDANEVIRSLAGILRRLADDDIEVDLVLDENAGPVRIEQSQLEQVVVNLVVNARDAMPGGGRVTVCTSVRNLDAPGAELMELEPGRYLRLDVEDTGVGIEPAILPRIYEPFFTTKPVGKGTGLGLSTVYGIVAQSNGHLGVVSTMGQGARFTVHLPVAR